MTEGYSNSVRLLHVALNPSSIAQVLQELYWKSDQINNWQGSHMFLVKLYLFSVHSQRK